MNRTLTFVGVVATVMLVACQSGVTPDEAFCDQAVPVLVQQDMGPVPEDAVLTQMEELAQAAEVLPENQGEPLMVLIDDLRRTIRVFQQGQSDEGWASFKVVEYVGELCGRDDLTSWMVTP